MTRCGARHRAVGVAQDGLRQLVRHPLRTSLTALTSAVAIAVTVNVISLVYGLDEDMRGDASRFGRRTVDVSRFPVIVPGLEREPFGDAQRASIESALEDLDVTVVPRRLVAGRAVGNAALDRISVVATSPDYPLTFDVPILAGRWSRGVEQATCVLDASAASSLFPELSPSQVVGREITLELPGATRDLAVVGVLQDPITHRAVFEAFDEGRGARTLTSGLLSFRNVYLHERALGPGEYSGLSVVAPDEGAVEEIARRLRDLWPPPADGALLAPQSVGVLVRREWMDLIGGTSQAGAFLGNIVWIIIVGVAVVMLSTLNFSTIRERYDELAIRRVEGAGREDVAWQITVEGVTTSLVGGLVGLPIGYLGAGLLRRIVDFPFRFELRYALLATGIAVLLGLLASVLPARHAAALQPVRVLSRRQS